MMVKRNFFTLTLMGLMAVAFIFPVCVNAQIEGEEPPILLEPAAATYNLQPTFVWSAVSGATKFDITIGSATPVTITDPNLETDDPATPDVTEETKWSDSRLVDDTLYDTDELKEAEAKKAAADIALGIPAANCANLSDGSIKCWYQYTPEEALAIGDTTWQVKAIREVGKDDFDGTNSTSELTSLGLYGDVTLTLGAPDKAAAEPGDTVTMSVSLDNSTNGAIPLSYIKFGVTYESDFTITQDTITVKGTAATITPAITVGAASVLVELTADDVTGAIEAGTGDIVELVFTVVENPAAGDRTFGLAACRVESDTVLYDMGSEGDPNPSACEGSHSVVVGLAITEGDLNGDEAVDLKDAILGLKVLAGKSVDDVSKPISAEDAAALALYTARYDKITMGVVISILVKVAG